MAVIRVTIALWRHHLASESNAELTCGYSTQRDRDLSVIKR
jgi:hypothetical protein